MRMNIVWIKTILIHVKVAAREIKGYVAVSVVPKEIAVAATRAVRRT